MLVFQACYVSEPSYDSILHDGILLIVLLLRAELWLDVVSIILPLTSKFLRPNRLVTLKFIGNSVKPHVSFTTVR